MHPAGELKCDDETARMGLRGLVLRSWYSVLCEGCILHIYSIWGLSVHCNNTGVTRVFLPFGLVGKTQSSRDGVSK